MIDNDFHNRKDLAPNISAVYVAPEYRNLGIAGKLLEYITKDIGIIGFEKLYLITNLIGFYEKYNWKYICNVKEDDGKSIKMYSKDL